MGDWIYIEHFSRKEVFKIWSDRFRLNSQVILACLWCLKCFLNYFHCYEIILSKFMISYCAYLCLSFLPSYHSFIFFSTTYLNLLSESFTNSFPPINFISLVSKRRVTWVNFSFQKYFDLYSHNFVDYFLGYKYFFALCFANSDSFFNYRYVVPATNLIKDESFVSEYYCTKLQV